MTGGDIRPGQPDPFPDDHDPCCRETERGYLCTRTAGHPLPHLAVGGLPGAPQVVLAVWPPYREATDEEFLAGMAAADPPALRGHRPLPVIAGDVHALVAAGRAGDADRIKALIEPYFTETDWCCLFALAGGLMAITARAAPPVAPGARVRVEVEPGAGPAETTWGHMIAANLRGDTTRCGDLFVQAVAGGYVGELMAVAVLGAADADDQVDRQHKAHLS